MSKLVPSFYLNQASVFFRPVSCFIMLVFFIAAIALAYVGGVMSGRASAEKSYDTCMAEKHAKREQSRENFDTLVLAPEELEFARVLRNEQHLALRAQSYAFRKDTKPKEVASSQSEIRGSSPKTLIPTEVPNRLYDFIFQVAAMKNEESADTLRQRLEGRGLRTFLKKDGKFLLIQVRFRGDGTSAQQVIQVLEQMHLGRPFLLSQKVVE